jgi:hypothetical protein
MNNRINEIVNSERIDIETSMNILINAVQEKYDEFSDIDKYLIGKSLSTFLSYYESKEDIVIKFNKDE